LLGHVAPDEIEAVIAPECGHILLEHVFYHSMAQFLDAARRLLRAVRTPHTGGKFCTCCGSPLTVR